MILHINADPEDGRPALLLVHGMLSSRNHWLPNLSLSERFRVVAIDLPAHGLSPAPESEAAAKPDALVQAIEAVRERLQISRWNICGQSFGSALTLHYALTFPDRVIAQVFTNANGALRDSWDASQQRRNLDQIDDILREGHLAMRRMAVSRQVKVLEDYLGVVLFKRLHRGIELTDEGQQLYDGVTRAFLEIGNAAKRVSRRGRRDILAIQSYTTFSQRWLIPRLTQFHDTFPRIEVRLSSSIAPVDFETQNLDAAIRAGKGSWPDLHCEKLVDVELIPICSPAFQATHKLKSPDDLSRVRLLHSMVRPTDWNAWIKRVGAAVDPEPGVRFESSALAYEAASLDIGVAIATKVFVNRHLQAGSFVAPFDMTCYSGEGYYLTWPKNISSSLPLQKFLVWMREQIGDEEHS